MPRICKNFEITRTIYSNSERSEHPGGFSYLINQNNQNSNWKKMGFRNMQEKLEKRFFLKLHLIVSSGRFTDGLTKCSIVDLQRSPMHMGCILLDSKVDIYIFKPESRTNQVFHTKVLEGKKPLECNICHQKLSRMVTLFQFMESKTKAISNVNFVMMISILYLKVHTCIGRDF